MLTFVLFMFIYTESKREKSLWLLTQNFVKLFLCSDVSREIFWILFLSRAIRLSLIWLILVFLSSRWIWLHLTVLQWPCLVTPTTPLLWEVIDLTIIIFALQSYLGVDSLKLFWCLCSKNSTIIWYCQCFFFHEFDWEGISEMLIF